MTDLDHEKIFLRAGAPWPPGGEVFEGSLQDEIPITDALRDAGWQRMFFAHAQGIDASEATTNLLKPHEYIHPFVVLRVGLNFQMPGHRTSRDLDATLRWLQPRLLVRAEVSLTGAWVLQGRCPFYVDGGARFRVLLSCAPGAAPREPAPPITARCVLDSLIVRR